MDKKLIQLFLTREFTKWGIPGRIRVDNGSPFGSPQRTTVPELALWLIGLGIQVAWNSPRQPKENAKVERNQGTTSKWVEIDQCKNISDLQMKLDEACLIQREKYPVARLGFKKRAEVFPGLFTNLRKYNPRAFQIEKVHAFLGQVTFVRKINRSVGKITFYDQDVYIGFEFRNLRHVILKLNLEKLHWEIYNEDKKLIATLSANNFSAEHIQNLTVRQKTYVKASVIET